LTGCPTTSEYFSAAAEAEDSDEVESATRWYLSLIENIAGPSALEAHPLVAERPTNPTRMGIDIALLGFGLTRCSMASIILQCSANGGAEIGLTSSRIRSVNLPYYSV
jgi:hypothetical protein